MQPSSPPPRPAERDADQEADGGAEGIARRQQPERMQHALAKARPVVEIDLQQTLRRGEEGAAAAGRAWPSPPPRPASSDTPAPGARAPRPAAAPSSAPPRCPATLAVASPAANASMRPASSAVRGHGRRSAEAVVVTAPQGRDCAASQARPADQTDGRGPGPRAAVRAATPTCATARSAVRPCRRSARQHVGDRLRSANAADRCSAATPDHLQLLGIERRARAAAPPRPGGGRGCGAQHRRQSAALALRRIRREHLGRGSGFAAGPLLQPRAAPGQRRRGRAVLAYQAAANAEDAAAAVGPLAGEVGRDLHQLAVASRQI